MKKLSPSFWLVAIAIVGLLLRLNAAADPFLHEWDEQFHALVAKNLLLHPLLPTLYESPVLPFDFRDWSACHLWLSKGPLPLWAMTGSFQLFGISEWSLRLPSLLFSMGGIWLTFSIGQRLFDVRTGLWAAFFHAIHGLTIEVAGGRISSDHPETAFLFSPNWPSFSWSFLLKNSKNDCFCWLEWQSARRFYANGRRLLWCFFCS